MGADRPVGVDLDAGEPPEQVLDRRAGRGPKRPRVVVERVPTEHDRHTVGRHGERVEFADLGRQHEAASVEPALADLDLRLVRREPDERGA